MKNKNIKMNKKRIYNYKQYLNDTDFGFYSLCVEEINDKQ